MVAGGPGVVCNSLALVPRLVDDTVVQVQTDEL